MPRYRYTTLLKCCLALSILPALSACDFVTDKIDQKIEQAIPEVSAEQAQQVDKLYAALQKNDFEWIKEQADDALLKTLNEQDNTLAYLAKQLPQEAPSGEKQLLNITKSVQTGQGKTLVVTYQYTYPLELVHFTVLFDGSENGSTKIKGLQINKQLNPNTTQPNTSVPSKPDSNHNGQIKV